MSTTSAKPVARTDAVADAQVRPVTLCEAFQATAERRGDAVALRTAGGETEVTWRQYAERVRSLAAGLAAHGVDSGDTVGLMLTNRPEACLVDTAALHLGAVPFSVYTTSSPPQIEHLFANADCRVVVTERRFVERILAVRPSLPALEYVFVVDGALPGTAGLAELEATGEDDFDFRAAWRSVTPDDLATLIYTSGTTGPPKGVELTHANLMFECRTFIDVMGLEPDGRLMSYLPMAHLADRIVAHYLAIVTGASITCVADPKQAVPALADTRPTLWLGVPRVWEKLKAALETRFAAVPDEGKRTAVARAIAAGIERVRIEQRGEAVPDELRVAAEHADEELFAAVRRQLGFDRAQFLLSGAAPIGTSVLEFFAALGLPIYEGWGMTESSAAATLAHPGAVRFGTVGRPLPGVDVELADDGELLIRGPLVMRGYRKQPGKTAETVDADGWLHTGDIGEIDADGFVKIVDRKKELIISAAGKNMSPANIEAELKSASPLIGIAVAIGDGRPYNTALIVLEQDAAGAYAAEHGIEAVESEVAGAVDRANERLSRVEQIKKHTLVPEEWEPGGDELTPTMKLKRKPIAQKHAELIDAMYSA